MRAEVAREFNSSQSGRQSVRGNRGDRAPPAEPVGARDPTPAAARPTSALTTPGRGGRGAGRGAGRGPGHGGRGDYQGSLPARDPTELGSFFLAPGCSPPLFPNTVSRKYCGPWFYVGQSCDRPYGECPGYHGNFDKIMPTDKRLIADHVASTPGIWFNSANVRTLTSPGHLAQLGDSSGPPGTT